MKRIVRAFGVCGQKESVDFVKQKGDGGRAEAIAGPDSRGISRSGEAVKKIKTMRRVD